MGVSYSPPERSKANFRGCGVEKYFFVRHTRPNELIKDDIGPIEGMKCINGTEGKAQQGKEARAALHKLVMAVGRPASRR